MTRSSRRWTAVALRLGARAVLDLRLAVDLLRLMWSFRARDWYRRPPFLPLPPRVYLRWRMFTAYGDESAVPPLEDVVNFARWRRGNTGLWSTLPSPRTPRSNQAAPQPA